MMFIVPLRRPICKWKLRYTLCYCSVQRPRQRRRLFWLYKRVQFPASSECFCVCRRIWSSKMSSRILVALLVLFCTVCVQSDVEAEAKAFLQRFDVEASSTMYQYSLASWAYNTNITTENSDKLVSMWKLYLWSCRCIGCSQKQLWCKLLIFIIWCVCFCSTQSEQGQVWGKFYSNMSAESLKFPINQIKDPQIKLQLISLQDKGSGALSPDKAAHVRQFLWFLK